MQESTDGTPADPTPSDGTPADPTPPDRPSRLGRWLAVVLLVGGVATLVALTIQQMGDSDAADDPGVELATQWSHPDAGVALELPETWEQIAAVDPQVLLVATPNERDSVLVRMVDLNIEVTEDEIEGVRSFTEDLVVEGTGVEVVAGPQRVVLDDLPGWYYLYRFEDPATGDVGIHGHYFLFDRDRMIVLVFQALPEAGFVDLAPTFDAIAESFRLTS